jgi:DNA-binding NtrC family response regulator
MTPTRLRLLVVHDDRAFLTLIGTAAIEAGFEVSTADTAAHAIAQLRHRPAHLVLFDLDMPGSTGLDVLTDIRDVNPGTRVVLVGRDRSHQCAVEAVNLGAIDYLTKPVDVTRVQRILSLVRDEMTKRRLLLELESEIAQRLEVCGMVGRGPAMHHVFSLVRRLAPHARAALISGEAGTGKELTARALHQLGPRSEAPFLVVNCSAAVETLLESELFGHVTGAFAGAASDRAGLFETAAGATIFLDHIGDLSPAVQARLLPVLTSGTFERVGSADARVTDIHIIAATARDLRSEVAAGRFLGDLYDVLSTASINLPALCNRADDIPYLCASFVRSFARRFNKTLNGVTPGAERVLMSAAWEGNVGQLRHVLERACMLAEGEFISETELEQVMRPSLATATAALQAWTSGIHADVPAPLIKIEREHIARTLDAVNGNKVVAARLLGISRRAFYRQLERHGLHTRIPAVRDAGRASHSRPGDAALAPVHRS